MVKYKFATIYIPMKRETIVEVIEEEVEKEIDGKIQVVKQNKEVKKETDKWLKETEDFNLQDGYKIADVISKLVKTIEGVKTTIAEVLIEVETNVSK